MSKSLQYFTMCEGISGIATAVPKMNGFSTRSADDLNSGEDINVWNQCKVRSIDFVNGLRPLVILTYVVCAGMCEAKIREK